MMPRLVWQIWENMRKNYTQVDGHKVLVLNGEPQLSVETFDAGGTFGWAVFSDGVRIMHIGDGLPSGEAANAAGKNCVKRIRELLALP